MDQNDLTVLANDDRPFVVARVAGGHVEWQGSPQCSVGEKVPMPDGQRPEGLYAEWSWDGERLVAVNDRFGMWPLFYAWYNGEVTISPSMDQVLRHTSAPVETDHDALAVSLRLGHPVGDDTPFSHIRSLPPNSRLIWERGGLTVEAAEGPVVSESRVQGLSFDEAADRFAEAFHNAIGRRLPVDEQLVMPLSGGRDSRHILFALDAHGVRPQAVATLKYRPPATNEDVRVADLIASEMDIEHVVLEKASSWFQAVRQEVSLSNYTGGSHSWILPLAAYLQGRTSTLYDGLAGSVLSGGFMNDETRSRLYAEGRFEELARNVLASGREGFIGTVLKRPFRERLSLGRAVERLARELERHADAPNPMLSFIFWNRTRRGVSQVPLSIMSGISSVHCPYLDSEVFDLLIGIDQRFLLDNKLHDEVIRRAYPRYAHIPFEDSTKKASYSPEDYAYFRKATKEFGQYLVKQRSWNSQWIRSEFLYPRIGYDLAKRKNLLPWYLVSSVYCLELEKVWNEGLG